MILIYRTEIYTIKIVVEKDGYVAILKEETRAISQGSTIEEAVEGLFPLLDAILKLNGKKNAPTKEGEIKP